MTQGSSLNNDGSEMKNNIKYVTLKLNSSCIILVMNLGDFYHISAIFWTPSLCHSKMKYRIFPIIPIEPLVTLLYGPYHKGEWPWWQGSVVVDAVSHTNLHLSFLDPVARSIVQQTHYSVDGNEEELMVKRRE